MAEMLEKVDWVAPEMVEPSTPVVLDSKRTELKSLAPAPVSVTDKSVAEIAAKSEESKSILPTLQEKKEAVEVEISTIQKPAE